jgi:hypothetical protein
MGNLATCVTCGGLVPPRRATCPHCDRPIGRAVRAARRLAMAAGGGAMLMTLMACYGGPPRCEPGTDLDGDRACTKGPRALDCDDHDPTIRPWAEDKDGDGVDQNCDGVDGMKPSGTPPAGSSPP